MAGGRVMPGAALVPLLCAVHCAATPLLVLATPALAHDSSLEWAGFALAAVLGAYAAVVGWRVHRRAAMWIPIGGGLAIWLAGLLELSAAAPEWFVTAAGALMLAAGVLWDARLRHRERCSECGCGGA